ncbi:glycosyltransferase [Desulfocicer niacini]
MGEDATSQGTTMNLKILHIIDSGGLYGAEMMLLTLVEEQIRSGMKPLVASIGTKKIYEKPFETEAIKRGIELIKFRMMPGPNIMGGMKILQYARKQGVHVLHSHGYKGNILLGFLLNAHRRLPMIATVHGYTSALGFSKMSVYKSLDLLSHQMIDTVVLVNKRMREHPDLKKRKRVKYHVVNNGIPIERKKTDSPPNVPIPGETHDIDSRIRSFCAGNGLVIGTIGRLSKEKGYIDAIKMLYLLRKEKKIDIRLVIIGEGTERTSLEGCISAHGLSRHVMMPGYIKDAGRFMPLFNVYIISSLSEGLPITLLEAMQAKIPIVSSHVGGIPEVLDFGKAGILVPPGCPGLMAESVFSLLHDKKKSKQLIDNAYMRLICVYSSSTMASAYLNLYRTLIC